MRNLRTHIFGFALILAMGACLCVSCIYEDFGDEPLQGFSFGASGSGTRATFNGLVSEFETGDRVGSIVEITRDGSTTVETLEWKVNDAQDLVLVNETGYLQKIPGDDEALIAVTDGYSLKFHFWYPYFTDEEAQKGSIAVDEQAQGDINTFIQSMTFPYISLPALIDTWNPEPSRYAWNANMEWAKNYHANNMVKSIPSCSWNTENDKFMYPLFANICQSTKDQVKYTDFMWANPSREELFTSSSKGTKKLYFAKKTSVIEVTCDTDLTDVWFENAAGIFRGSHIDLSTGVLTSLAATDYSGDAIYGKNFTPYQYPGENRFRLHLPPQNNFKCNLHCTVAGNPVVLSLAAKLTELKENTLYTISIGKTGDCTLIINDWENGDGIVLFD